MIRMATGELLSFVCNIVRTAILVSDGTSSGTIFLFQAEDGIRDLTVTGVQTCALPICRWAAGGGRYCAAGARHRARSITDRDQRPTGHAEQAIGGRGSGEDQLPGSRGRARLFGLRSEERRVGKGWWAGGGRLYART